MTHYLLITDRGINTTPVRADTDAELAAALREETRGTASKVAAIELLVATDMAADGTVPQTFTDARNNRANLVQKAQQALTVNQAYLGHAAIPAGTLTTAQLSNIARQLSDQLDNITKECSAVIRLLLGQLDSTAGTGP